MLGHLRNMASFTEEVIKTIVHFHENLKKLLTKLQFNCPMWGQKVFKMKMTVCMNRFTIVKCVKNYSFNNISPVTDFTSHKRRLGRKPLCIS